MKRRCHSTTKKKAVMVIHTKVRSFSSLRGTINRSFNDNQNSPMKSVKNNQRLTQTISVSQVSKDGTKKRASSMNYRQTDIELKCPTKSEVNLRKPSPRIPWKSIQEVTENADINVKETLFIPKQTSMKSVSKGNVRHETNVTDEQNGTKKTNIQTIQVSSIDDYHRRRSTMRRTGKMFGHGCCSCSRFCVLMSLFISLLLGIALAVLITALLSKSRAIVSTTTVTTATTSTTTTTTTTVGLLPIGLNDTLVGLWNTTTGSASTLSTPGTGVGNYIAVEGPPNAFDRNCTTKYLSFGECVNNGPGSSACGINTGFQVTLVNGAVLMQSLRFCTANDASQRDPITMTLEGSNGSGSALLLGSSWTLIYNGSCGLDSNPGRSHYGQTVTFPYNVVPYSSYRVLITSKRGITYAVQYGELELFTS